MLDLVREVSVELYRMASELALTKGIVIADTKFELGFIDGELHICDEALTMDSSRFWPADQVTLGATPPSFDKQPVARLRRLTRLGQDRARAADTRRGHRRHQRPLHRGLPDHHRSAALGLAWPRVSLEPVTDNPPMTADQASLPLCSSVRVTAWLRNNSMGGSRTPVR